MAQLLLKTLAIYLSLLVVIRLMGKRQVGELEVSELVVTFLLSELAVLPITNQDTPVTHAVVPIAFLLFAEIAFSFAISKSAFVRKIMLGKPNIIIRKGVLDEKELSKLRVSIAELMGELRLNGISCLSEVDYAIVEDNGKISVFRADNSEVKGIAHCVISDGKVSHDGLKDACRDEKWLAGELKNRGAAVRDILMMTVDDGGKVFIIMKEKG